MLRNNGIIYTNKLYCKKHTGNSWVNFTILNWGPTKIVHSILPQTCIKEYYFIAKMVENWKKFVARSKSIDTYFVSVRFVLSLPLPAPYLPLIFCFLITWSILVYSLFFLVYLVYFFLCFRPDRRKTLSEVPTLFFNYWSLQIYFSWFSIIM